MLQGTNLEGTRTPVVSRSRRGCFRSDENMACMETTIAQDGAMILQTCNEWAVETIKDCENAAMHRKRKHWQLRNRVQYCGAGALMRLQICVVVCAAAVALAITCPSGSARQDCGFPGINEVRGVRAATACVSPGVRCAGHLQRALVLLE